MAVRNTRLLRGRVQAEVGLGHQRNGTWIGVTVELDLKDAAIKAAVEELHRVIEERALTSVTEAMFDRAKRTNPERTP